MCLTCLGIYILEYFIRYTRKRMGNNMKKDLVVLLFGIVLITVIFCGCQGSQVENNYETIFESDVVNLLNYTIESRTDNADNIVEVTVDGRIGNIVDRQLRIVVTAEFYDKNENYIGEEIYRIYGLRVKPNPGYSTTFTIKYNGEGVDMVDHVKLRAEEIT